MNRQQLLLQQRQHRLRQALIRERAQRQSILLDRAKDLTGSDYATAKEIGVIPQHVCDFRKGRRPLAPFAALELGNLLKESPFRMVLLALASGGHSKKSRRIFADHAFGIWPESRHRYERWVKSRKLESYPNW